MAEHDGRRPSISISEVSDSISSGDSEKTPGQKSTPATPSQGDISCTLRIPLLQKQEITPTARLSREIIITGVTRKSNQTRSVSATRRCLMESERTLDKRSRSPVRVTSSRITMNGSSGNSESAFSSSSSSKAQISPSGEISNEMISSSSNSNIISSNAILSVAFGNGETSHNTGKAFSSNDTGNTFKGENNEDAEYAMNEAIIATQDIEPARTTHGQKVLEMSKSTGHFHDATCRDSVLISIRVDQSVMKTGTPAMFAYKFSRNPKKLYDQIENLCQEKGIGDREGSEVLLLHTKRGQTKWIVRGDDLLDLQNSEELRLVDGVGFIRTCLEKLGSILLIGPKTGTSSEDLPLHDSLESWLDCILHNVSAPEYTGDWFSSELIGQKGLTVLMNGLVELHRTGDMKRIATISGPLLASLAVLMEYDAARKHVEGLLDANFLECLLATLFGRMKPNSASIFGIPRTATGDHAGNAGGIADCNASQGCHHFTMNVRRAALTLIDVLLQTAERGAAVQLLHNAATRCISEPNKNDPTMPAGSVSLLPASRTYYNLFVEAARDDSDPAHSISLVLFSFLLDCCDADLQKQVLREIQKIPDSGVLLAPYDNMDRLEHKNFVSSLLMHNMIDSIVEVESGIYREKTVHQSKEVVQLKAQISRLETRRRKLESELRHYHLVMMKMVDLISIDDDHLYNSLKNVVNFGWDTMRWRKGYTVLHFVAECLDDPRIVELFALLSSDMSARDSNGKRALDYARKEKLIDNVKVLERVRKQKIIQERTERMIINVTGGRDGSNYVTELPENLTPILHDGIETVLTLGWEQVRWPNEFTILHLAAQSGSLAAVKFLLERVPGVAKHYMKVDNHNQRPIDYAIGEKFDEIVEYLSNFDPEQLRTKGDNETAEQEWEFSIQTHDVSGQTDRQSSATSRATAHANISTNRDSTNTSINRYSTQLQRDSTTRGGNEDGPMSDTEWCAPSKVDTGGRRTKQMIRRFTERVSTGSGRTTTETPRGMPPLPARYEESEYVSARNRVKNHFTGSVLPSTMTANNTAETQEQYQHLLIEWQAHCQDSQERAEEIFRVEKALLDLQPANLQLGGSSSSTASPKQSATSSGDATTAESTAAEKISVAKTELVAHVWRRRDWYSSKCDLDDLLVQIDEPADSDAETAAFQALQSVVRRRFDELRTRGEFPVVDGSFLEKRFAESMLPHWPDHRTPLHDACKRGDLESVKFLLSMDFDPRGPDKTEKKPAFALAVDAGHSQIVDFLRKYKFIDDNDIQQQQRSSVDLTRLQRVVNKIVTDKRGSDDASRVKLLVQLGMATRELQAGKQSRETLQTEIDQLKLSQPRMAATGQLNAKMDFLQAQIEGKSAEEAGPLDTVQCKAFAEKFDEIIKSLHQDAQKPSTSRPNTPRGGTSALDQLKKLLRETATEGGAGLASNHDICLAIEQIQHYRRLARHCGVGGAGAAGSGTAGKEVDPLTTASTSADTTGATGTGNRTNAASATTGSVDSSFKSSSASDSLVHDSLVEDFVCLKEIMQSTKHRPTEWPPRPARLSRERVTDIVRSGQSMAKGSVGSCGVVANPSPSTCPNRTNEGPCTHEGPLYKPEDKDGINTQVAQLAESGKADGKGGKFGKGGKRGKDNQTKVGATEGGKPTAPDATSDSQGNGKNQGPSLGKKGPTLGKNQGPSLGKNQGPSLGKKGPSIAGKGPSIGGKKGAPSIAGKGPSPGGRGEAVGKAPPGFDQKSTKEYIKPKDDMKPLWWSKVRNVEKTVWTDIPDVYLEWFKPHSETVETDFVEKFKKKKNAVKEGETKEKTEKKETKEMKLIQIIVDPMKQGGLTAMCKTLPEPNTLKQALLDLDDVLLDVQTLEWIRKDLSPQENMLVELEKLRKANPESQFALPETYMWAIGHVPGYQQRIDCWLFVRTYEERHRKCMTAYLAFQAVMQSLRKSKMFRKLLGLILCAGNYLNGGTGRGQAEGFEMDALNSLDSVKDGSNTKSLMWWVTSQFFSSEYFLKPHEEKTKRPDGGGESTAIGIKAAPKGKPVSKGEPCTKGVAPDSRKGAIAESVGKGATPDGAKGVTKGEDADNTVTGAGTKGGPGKGSPKGTGPGRGADSAEKPGTTTLCRTGGSASMSVDNLLSERDMRNRLFDELRPLFSAVRRRIEKTSDGTEHLTKQVSVCIEEYDQMTDQLKEEFDERFGMLQNCLKNFTDPCDTFRTVLQDKLINARHAIEALMAKKLKIREEFQDLLAYYCFGKIQAADMIRLVDNLIVPGDLIVNKSLEMKKKYFIPNFCGSKIPNCDTVMALWDLKEPDLKADEKNDEAKRKSHREHNRKVSKRMVENRRNIRGKSRDAPAFSCHSVNNGEAEAIIIDPRTSAIVGADADGRLLLVRRPENHAQNGQNAPGAPTPRTTTHHRRKSGTEMIASGEFNPVTPHVVPARSPTLSQAKKSPTLSQSNIPQAKKRATGIDGVNDGAPRLPASVPLNQQEVGQKAAPSRQTVERASQPQSLSDVSHSGVSRPAQSDTGTPKSVLPEEMRTPRRTVTQEIGKDNQKVRAKSANVRKSEPLISLTGNSVVETELSHATRRGGSGKVVGKWEKAIAESQKQSDAFRNIDGLSASDMPTEEQRLCQCDVPNEGPPSQIAIDAVRVLPTEVSRRTIAKDRSSSRVSSMVANIKAKMSDAGSRPKTPRNDLLPSFGGNSKSPVPTKGLTTNEAGA